ncbi:unnamed protein product [Schistocephalus solidus]|uniref:Nudix hydrolase domain-containing protein n=1 Tax=Schistocephalus solidus TaxID=70667 RepID=A0A183T2A0_SCHSO|nr:unnamed protein product [Schistocephalus solidus]
MTISRLLAVISQPYPTPVGAPPEARSSRDDELAACIEQSKKIEMHYGHFFDFVLVPQDFQSGLQELRSIALNLDRKPQWVPAHWIPLAIEVAARAAEEAKRSSANSGP